jgi:hypothetical protein
MAVAACSQPRTAAVFVGPRPADGLVCVCGLTWHGIVSVPLMHKHRERLVRSCLFLALYRLAWSKDQIWGRGMVLSQGPARWGSSIYHDEKSSSRGQEGGW